MKAEIQENLITFKLNSSTRNALFLMILIGIVSFVGGFFGLHFEARQDHIQILLGRLSLLLLCSF